MEFMCCFGYMIQHNSFPGESNIIIEVDIAAVNTDVRGCNAELYTQHIFHGLSSFLLSCSGHMCVSIQGKSR